MSAQAVYSPAHKEAAIATVRINVLGPLEALVDGAPVAIGGPQQRRLLMLLLLERGNVVSPDRMVDVLWPDDDAPEGAARSVLTYVSRLRAALVGNSIATVARGYCLERGDTSSDVDEVAWLVDEAARSQPQRAIDCYERALAMWRGPAYAEFNSEWWALSEATRLSELRVVARERRAEALITVGYSDLAVADLEKLVIDEPTRERPVTLLMQAMQASGRHAEALRAAHGFRARLAEDTGLDPSPKLLELERAVAAGETAARPLRGYLLGDRIGDGSFAEVYRGTQPSVGRDVAIKVIRAELANRPEFIRRFEVEAHVVAHLEHPHIVPLYDYWREPGGAYLVMRLLRGGTLARRIESRRLDVDEAIRLAEHVGEALAVAHQAGIVHRDVKPANVLLDGGGNFFLGDFGIALEAAAPVHPTDTLSIGSPAYASPEQLRRQPVGPTADVHGLAITLFEALSGQLPFPEARTQAELLRRQLNDPLPSLSGIRPAIPGAVDAVLARAAAKDCASRFPSIDEFVSAFTAAVRGVGAAPRPGVATAVGSMRNPYKGLRAFQEADAADFHGRHRLVDRLVAKLAAARPTARFLAVVGPSGSGKSSVVRAGLLPAIRSDALPGSSAWFLTSMIPGAHPFEELELALNRIATAPTAGLAEMMAANQRGIARAVKQACPVDDAEVVVVIDQLEELFTLCADDVTRQRFISGLVEAITDPRSRLRVVATLRADFYDRPLRYPELAPLIEESSVTVSPLAPDELERAIIEPAERVGAAFEPGLVAQIVADVLDQPGALPLLQYALTELFDLNVSGLMTRSAYDELGGLSGALARRAEQLYDAATPDERDVTRRVFTRLVTLGEGTEDTRRRVRRSEFVDAAAPTSEAGRMIDLYGAARLLAFDRDPLTREPTVEVAHEALIREWPRLRSWLDDDRDGLRTHRHLTEATAGWEASGRDPSELYRGGRLEVAEAFVAAHDGDLNTHEAAFMAASVEQRVEHQLAERRSRRRLRRSLVAVAGIAVLALLAGMVAFAQRRDALSARDRADSALDQGLVDRLAAESQAALDTRLDVAMLLAAEAYQRQPSLSTRRALLTALTHQVSADSAATMPVDASFPRRSASRLLSFIPMPYTQGGDLDLSSDGSRVAVWDHWGIPNRLGVFDTASAKMVAELPTDDGGGINDYDLSPDGKWLLFVADDGLDLVAVDTGVVRTVPVQFAPEPGQETEDGFRPDAIFTADSERFVVSDLQGRLEMWDAASVTVVPALLPPELNVDQLLITREGYLATFFEAGDVVTVLVWDMDTGTTVRSIPLESPDRWPDKFALAPDVSLLAGIDNRGQIALWDGSTGRVLPTPEVPGARALAFDPIDPHLLILGSGTGHLLTYDVSLGRLVGAPLRERSAGIFSIVGAEGPAIMATVADDDVITIWGDNAGPGLIDGPLIDGPLASGVSRAVYGGDVVVVQSLDHSRAEVRRADDPARPGVELQKPPGMEDYVYREARPSADGSAVLSKIVDATSDDPGANVVFVADPDTGAVRWVWQQADLPLLEAVSISPDGRFVAGGGIHRPVSVAFLEPGFFQTMVVDMVTGRVVLDVDDRSSGPPAFSADGRYLDIGDDIAKKAYRYDLSNPGTRVATDAGIELQGGPVEIPGTSQIAGAARGVGLARFDMATGAIVDLEPSPDGSNLLDTAASPDGSLIVGLHFFTGNLLLYDVTAMEAIGVIAAGSGPDNPVGFTPDGRLVADGLMGTATVWDLDPDHWLQIACHAAGRNLTQAEWNRYVGSDEPLRATCAEWPADA